MPLESTSDPDFDARWAAWVARGVAHDRAVRRRFTVGLRVAVIVLVVALAYLWFIR